MTLLQTPVINGAVERSFQTSPDTVYGILIGLLVIMVIVCIYGVVKMYKDNKDTNRDYRDKMLQVVEDNTNVFGHVKESLQKNTETIDRHTNLLMQLNFKDR